MILLPEGVTIREPDANHLEWCKRMRQPIVQLAHFAITLRDPTTGREAAVTDDYGWRIEPGETVRDALDHAVFMWSEGNYACDCNRYLHFQRALGEDEDDVVCSKGRYEVVGPPWFVAALNARLS